MTKGFRFKKADIGVFKEKHANVAVTAFKKGCRIIGLTMGNFSLIDLIHATLLKTGKARVIVGTWSAGIKDVHQVKWMCDNDLITDFKLLTDHSYKSRQKRYAASIEELFGEENIRTSELHAKFVLIENDSYKVAIRSSMNLNANKTCELFEIDEDEEIYDFLMSFVVNTFNNMEKGFVKSSKKVNEVVKRFFDQQGAQESPARWWDLKTE